VGAVARDALSANTDFRVTALVVRLGAVRLEAFAVGALLPGRADHPDAVVPDAAALVAHLVGITYLLPAHLGKALAAGATLAGRAGQPDAILMYAIVLVADLSEIRTLLGRAIQRVAPAVGAAESRFALDAHTGPPLTHPVNAYFPFPETAKIQAVRGVAETARATLSFGTGDPRAAPLHALFVYAHLAVAGAFPGLAVDWIALPDGAALPLGAFNAYTTGVLAFLIDAHLSQTRAISPDAVLGVALPAGAIQTLLALHPQTSQVHAVIPGTDEPRRTIMGGAVVWTAESLDQHSVGTVSADNPPGAGHQKQVQ
jgi:hypothetical protein